jgi:1-deoxyxylulose-5-phosphate synthase
MHYRTLGRTGLQVSALALGTVELGLDYGIEECGAFGRPSEAAAISLVHAALDAGINFVDTARAYGESESILGKALAGRRNQVIVATKVDPRPPANVHWSDEDVRRFMQESLETSLRLLRTDHVDIWMIHSIDKGLLARQDALAEVFDDAQQRGQIGWTGASFYGVALPEAALAYDLFDVMQIAYSVFDQRLSGRVLPLAVEKGVGIVARSVLLKGVLTERAEYLPARLEPLRVHSRKFRQIVAELGGQVTSAQGAIAFALAQPQIDTVLVGARTEAELQEDLAAMDLLLTGSVLERLGALAIDDADLLNPSTWGIP